MTLITLYGLLALSTFCASLAARTCTLWKLGLLFLAGWVSITFVNFKLPYPQDGILFVAIYIFITVACAIIYKKYKCKDTQKVLFLFMFSVLASVYYATTNDYGKGIRIINTLFISQAIIIIYSSINRMISRRRRHIKLGPRGEERRVRPYTYRFGDMIWRDYANY